MISSSHIKVTSGTRFCLAGKTVDSGAVSVFEAVDVETAEYDVDGKGYS